MGKRLFDILAASAGLLLGAPLLIALAVWVKLDSAGPALFRQRRVGLSGRPFHIHKFRTMHPQAEVCGPAITADGDPRITRAGQFLRRYKLDELPQLLDVLVGSMSLVGPRPEVPKYVAMYPPETRARVLSVRPGITDEAAILFADEEQLLARSDDPEWTYVNEILPKKLELYEQYAAHHTLAGDLQIVGRTLARVSRRRGT